MDDIRSEMRTVLAALFASHCGSERLRKVADSGLWGDQELWDKLTDFGVHGFAAESIELNATVMEVAGEFLACIPLLSNQIATRLLTHLGEPAAHLLTSVADGSARLTTAIANPGSDPSVSSSTAPDGGCRLSGEYAVVVDGADADAILVQANAAEAPYGALVAVVRPGDPGVELTVRDSLDLTRRIAQLSLSDAHATVLAFGDSAAQALDRTSVERAYLLAAEQLGAAQRCLDMATSYAKTRVQFGKPIGVFQAISHACADMYVQVEASRSLVEATGRAIAEEDWFEARQYAAAVQSFASETLVDCAQRMVQIHGGIAITWEFDAHLYLRRAKSTEVLFGRPSAHRAHLLELSLAATEARS